MTDAMEIVPGQRIGPFELGMTRAEVEALELGEFHKLDDRSIYFLLTKDAFDEPSDFPVSRGVIVYFDESERCIKLDARLALSGGPLFQLGGEILNGLHPSKVPPHGDGAELTKWESVDEFYFNVSVFAPGEPA